MLTDVLTPDGSTGSRSYGPLGIRLASTFSIEARGMDAAEGRDDFERVGLIVASAG